MISVQELRDVACPSRLRHLWQELWHRTPRASFRQTPEFLKSQQTSADGRWRMLLVSAWSRPIGIVPLRERTIQRTLGTFRVLSLPESPWGFFPGCVGPHPTTALTAAVRHLAEQDPSWDVFELPAVVADGQKPQRIVGAFETSGLTPFQRTRRELCGVELPERASQFWANRDAASRHRWRELDLSLMRRDTVRFVRFRPRGAQFGDTDRDWTFLNLLNRVARRQPDADRVRQAQARIDLLRETHAAAVDAGSADVAILLIDSRPAAFAYNVHCRSRVESLLLLADPDVPHAADLLIGQMLQDEIARGDRWHTFLPSSTSDVAVDWRMWQCDRLYETTISHYRRPSVRSRLLRWWDGAQRVRTITP
ncbi:MAG TPA: GNAT family N-acetyltransferase [Planctomycetaceae bacterium]|nr:GNAT family N-acetyltransferase [Planctomycetaceae bacterium]